MPFPHLGEEGRSDLFVGIQVLSSHFLPFQFSALEAKLIFGCDQPGSDAFVCGLRNQGSSVEVGEEGAVLDGFVGKEVVWLC